MGDEYGIPDRPSRVLVVDDLPSNRKLMRLMFMGTEFTVDVASNGEEALEKVRADPPMLVLSDIRMPGMDGFELCRRLKEDEATRDVAVILVTAHHADVQKVSQGLNLGADDYITRPFHREELLARVRAVARIRRAEAEARHQAQVAERRNRELELLATLALAAGSTERLEEGFAPALGRLAHLLDAEAVALLLLMEAGSEEVRVCLATPTQTITTLAASCTCAGEVTPLRVQEEAPRLLAQVVAQAEPPLSLALDTQSRVRTIPMADRYGTIGALLVIGPRSALTASDWMLLNSVAGMVTVAVENTRLWRNVQRQIRELEQLNAEVQAFNRELERMVEARTRELMAEKEKTLAILAGMADGLLVLDAEGCVLTANAVAEAMLGFRLAEVQGKPLTLESERNPLWRQVMALAAGAEDEPAESVDMPDPAHEGRTLSIQARASRIRDAEGRFIGTAIVLRDVTALREVERMKARFMAGVTHELKTPLAVIKMHVNNMLTYHRRLSRARRKEMLQSIQRQVALLERLVEDILELSRMDAGNVEMSFAPVAMEEVVEGVVAEMRSLAQQKSLTLHWQWPEATLRVMGDAAQLERVVRNLLDNAIKYTPAGGSVTVSLRGAQEARRSFVELCVQDTGIGIPPEAQKRVFERFYRADPSHTVPGTGLGLAIVKEIVEAHRGTIHLESRLGEGSVFCVRFPGA